MGFLKPRLHASVIRRAHGESYRKLGIAAHCGGAAPPLATFQEPSHDIDVVGGKSAHGGNFAVGVSALAHPEDVLQQVHGLMLAAGTVLDEAGYETVFLIGRHDERGHLGLTKLTERFEAPLTANKIIERAILAMAAGYGYRALEADVGDVLDDPLEQHRTSV